MERGSVGRVIGIGTALNAAAILLGGALGLAKIRSIPASTQQWLKIVLAAMTVWVGVSLMWRHLHGPFLHFLKEFGILMLSLMLGRVLGQWLRLQKGVSRLAQFAKGRLAAQPHQPSDGFLACAALFCVGPLALVGALQDGLQGDYRILALKAALDGLAALGFVASLGAGVLLSALPVLAYQGTVTLLVRWAEPALSAAGLVEPVGAVAGFLVFATALVILDLKRVALADYVPSLILAPTFTYLFH